jgi:hypothetical protein
MVGKLITYVKTVISLYQLKRKYKKLGFTIVDAGISNYNTIYMKLETKDDNLYKIVKEGVKESAEKYGAKFSETRGNKNG